MESRGKRKSDVKTFTGGSVASQAQNGAPLAISPTKRLRASAASSTRNSPKTVAIKTMTPPPPVTISRRNSPRNRPVLPQPTKQATSTKSKVTSKPVANKIPPKNIKKVGMAVGKRKMAVAKNTTASSKKAAKIKKIDKAPASRKKTIVAKKLTAGSKSVTSIAKLAKSVTNKTAAPKGRKLKTGKRNGSMKPKVEAPEPTTTVRKKKLSPVQPETTAAASKKPRKLRKGAFVLSPKPDVTEYLVDPTFHSKTPLPYISPMFQSKLLIRAVIMQDKGMLTKLGQDKKSLYSYCLPQSISIEKTALHYAILSQDIAAMKFLTNRKEAEKLGPMSEWLIQEESTGRGSHMMFGHAMRSVTVGRGGKEGNGALLKDKHMYGPQCSRVQDSFQATHISTAMEAGIQMGTLEKMASLDPSTQPYFYTGWLSSIVYAVRAGQNELAGKLVELAIKKGGYGFNLLHQEALIKTSKFHLTPFKAISVPKKCTGNARITPLHCAAINPDPYCLMTLMGVQPDFNIVDLNNWTPVHYAAVCKGPGPMKYLLSRGISTNMIDKDGNTPMHSAARYGRVHNVKLILESESKFAEGDDQSEIPEVTSISRVNKAGLNVLHVACQNGHEKVVDVLLSAPGVDINKQTPAQQDKLSGLMLACQQGHLEVVKRLVAGGAKLQLLDRRGRVALTHAVMNGHAHVVSYLLRLGDNHLAKDSSGNTLVHYATAYGWYFIFKLLMEAGCSPNEANQWKMTPLSISFMKGNMGLVEILLKEPGVDVNSPIDDSKGMTLLLQTCSFKASDEMIARLKFLVETQGADCSISDSDKKLAAHYLVESESRELKAIEFQKARGWEVEKRTTHINEALKLVVKNGCNLEAKNSRGATPVASGIELGCFDLVQQMLQLGGKITSDADEEGDTILHDLVEHVSMEAGEKFYKTCAKDAQTLKLMKEMAKVFNSRGMTPLLQTLDHHKTLKEESEVKRVVRFILFLVLQLESDVNAAFKTDESNKSTDAALHLAVQTNYSEEVLNILLSKNPKLDPLNADKRTPLVLAILRRAELPCRVLIEAGANVNFVSEKDDWKSCIMLEVSQKPNNFNLIPFFVEKGAVVQNIVDPYNGNSLLHFVSKNPTATSAVPALRSLLKAGIPVNIQNKYGRTSLHLAVNSRGGETDASYDVEDFLIESCASLGITDIHGRVPLHFAFLKIGKNKKKAEGSFMDPIELVTLLTSAMREARITEKIHAADEFGQLPLHCAATRGATISASHLIAEPSSKHLIDALDSNGNSPFSLSVINGHEGCALMFLQAGANFLHDLNRGIVGKTILEAFGESWVWKPLKAEAENQDQLSLSRSKYSILQEIVRKDWQGLLYLMLEKLKTSGIGVSPGIEAAFKTTRLTLAAKLIDRVKVNKELITKKQSLLHTLAQEAPRDGDTKELQIRILRALISKNADVNSLDTHQSTPLIYAAMKCNFTLCTEFTQLMNIRSIPTLKSDFLGRAPFSAIFWEAMSGSLELSADLKTWAEQLLYSGADGNILCQYPIQEPSAPGVRYIQVDANTNYFMTSVAVKYSPLIMSVIYGNYGVVKWLLSLKGKIDINFGDSLGRTPLMHAVRLNDIQMVKLLLNPQSYDYKKDKTPWCKSKSSLKPTGNINVNSKDKKGWTAIHHLVSPLSPSKLFYAQAECILELLRVTGAVLDSKNVHAETAFDMAVRLRQFGMVQKLAKILGVKAPVFEEFDPFPKIQITVAPIPIEISDADSKKMLVKMEEERMIADLEEPLAPPDDLSGLTLDNSFILMDEGRSVPFDCLLTQVDLNYGVYGLYNFYRMQLIQQTKGPKLLVLFTRWGRVGDKGQYQKTPFPTQEEGVKEFKKIFRSKTGNVWDELNNVPFTQAPKKYRLVNLERRKAQFSSAYAEKIKINFKEIESAAELKQSELQNDVLELTKQLSLEHKSASSKLSSGNSELLPFGLLSRESLEKAEGLLDKLESVLLEKDALQKKPDYSKDHYAKLMDSIVSISEEFYTLILVCGFASEKIGPLFQIQELRQKQELIRSLLHFEFASQLLLGAQFNLQNINPFDYVYRSLGTRIEPLIETSEEAQLILEYIYNTSESGERGAIEKIYRVEVPGEEERLSNTGIGNRHLLWHGTKTCNLLSILHRGLQVAPLGYAFNGSLFGKGIYFADMCGKSMKYCDGRGSGSKFMLLCEVALGEIQKVELERYRSNEFEPLKPGKNSLKTSNSRWKPLPSATVNWKGRTLPLGPKVENILPEDKDHGLNYNEYIVFQPKQVSLRYLVQFRDNNSIPEVKMQNIFTETT